jgi:hypothetical protein
MNHRKLRPIKKGPAVPAGYTQALTADGKVLTTHTGQPITFPTT